MAAAGSYQGWGKGRISRKRQGDAMRTQGKSYSSGVIKGEAKGGKKKEKGRSAEKLG